MKTVLRLMILLPALWLGGPALALTPGKVVDNFRLLDHNGKSHELYYLSDMKAIVLMVQGNGCPIVRHALPSLREVRTKYQSQGVEFLLLNSNLQDNRDTVAKEAQEFGIDFPILLDEAQLIGESLGVVRTSEVFVIDPKGWKLVYRGPLDDRLSYEKQRPATKHYLTDALDDMLAGRPVKVVQAEGVGCLVNFPERGRKQSHAQISYSKLVWTFSWGNSTRNPANPDPTAAIRWGDQTFEEMGIGFVRFRYLDEEVGKPAGDSAPIATSASTAHQPR